MIYSIDANTFKGEKKHYSIRADSYSVDGMGFTVFSNEGISVLMIPTGLIDSIKIRTPEQIKECWELLQIRSILKNST